MSHPIKIVTRCVTAIVAVILNLIVAATGARADTATLLLQDICDDPSQVFNYKWEQKAHGSSALFYMDATLAGRVSAVWPSEGLFDEYTTIYVGGHGSEVRTIAGIPHVTFVGNFASAHPAVPDKVFFTTCFSAKEPNSLLRELNTAYGGNVNTLMGAVKGCRLVFNGDGNGNLANATYRYAVGTTNPLARKGIEDAIMAKWSEEKQSEGSSWQNACEQIIAKSDWVGLNGFVSDVDQEFSKLYLELIGLNEGGTEFEVCGAGHEECR